jgi:WD40 repeat protein
MKKTLLLFFISSFVTNAFAQKIITQPSFILPNHTNDIDAVAISPIGNLMATGSWDKNINIYSADSPFTFIRPLLGHLAPVNALRFNRTGKLLASGSSDYMVKIWDSIFRVRNFEGHRGNINCLLFDNASRYLFSGSDDKTIIAWDIATGKPFRAINNLQAVNSLAMMNTEPRYLFVAGAEPKIKVYSLTSLQVTRTFDGHTDAVNSIDISKNSLYLISGSNDKSARIWDVKTGKELRKLPVDCWKVTAVAFTDDSKYAVTGCNDGSIKIWEVETGKLISKIESSGNVVRDIAFIKNMKYIAVASMLRGSSEYGLRIWPTEIVPPNKIISPLKSDTSKSIVNKMDTVKMKSTSVPSIKK